MASSWGLSWGSSWGNSWGTIAGVVTVSGGFKGEKKRRKKREEEKPIILRRGEQRYGPDNDYGLDSLDRPEPVKVEKKKKARPKVLTSFAELAAPEIDLSQFVQTSAQLQGLMEDMTAQEILRAQQMQMMQEQEDEEILMLMMLAS